MEKINTLAEAKKIITSFYGYGAYTALVNSWYGNPDMSKINEICKKRIDIIINFANKLVNSNKHN